MPRKKPVCFRLFITYRARRGERFIIFVTRSLKPRNHLRNHLGTITHDTDTSSTVQNEYSFDSWGRRRSFSNWGYTVAAQTDLLPTRGFTGLCSVSSGFGELCKAKTDERTNPAECSESGKWLSWFNLYNMNGRLYDPVVGRFLSPDNGACPDEQSGIGMQMPDFSQSFNRYSYTLNNPLKYTDPSGEEFTFWHFAAGCMFGMPAWGGIMKHASGQYTIGQAIGSYFVNSAAILVGAGVGSAVSSALGVSSTLGGAILNGSISGASSGFAGSFIGGAGNSWINDNNFGTGISDGLTAGGYGALGGALIGGISGGVNIKGKSLFFKKGV